MGLAPPPSATEGTTGHLPEFPQPRTQCFHGPARGRAHLRGSRAQPLRLVGGPSGQCLAGLGSCLGNPGLGSARAQPREQNPCVTGSAFENQPP